MPHSFETILVWLNTHHKVIVMHKDADPNVLFSSNMGLQKYTLVKIKLIHFKINKF